MSTTSEAVPVEIITARDVPLGGPRAMTVHRTLPQRRRSLIGAWCFCDHYGPDHVAATGGMDVAPHPNTGLQTVSWLFTGEIRHDDAQDVHAVVRPREVNLMTAGAGTCHSEVSTEETDILHGVQLWTVLPEDARHGPRRFDHLVNTGDLQARLILLGGEPFAEEVVMWWNFVGRSDEEIRSYREQWNDLDHAAERFGVTEGYVGHDQEGPRRLPAPVMPETPVRARTNPAPVARPGDDPYRPKDAR
ncbi:MAG: pirin family protein [Corynebacterium variabile]|uniref:pirin family protein n=1 Tax=Corynebacterium variabile TaxID=1727 RepID=UPI003F8E113B